MDPKTGVIFNDEQGEFQVVHGVWSLEWGKIEKSQTSVDVWVLIDFIRLTDDFAVPGAPDAFGLWPSPWNYPAPGKK